jgi:acetate CoA/acetoacetate CoA-transferase alpha subunit
MTDKLKSTDFLLEHIIDGSTIMFGGFGGIGTPPTIVKKIAEKGVKNLILIGNDTGFPTIGIGPLIVNNQVKKVITSHIGSNPIAGKLMHEGAFEIEFCPQGTLIERIRAGGVGLGGILVDVGIDTIVEDKKATMEINGKKYLIETALTADISIVFAKKGDPFGNLVYDKTARNTNPLVAMAGDLTFAEVEELVPIGALSPEEVITPGCFVNGVIQSDGVNWKWVWE